MRIGIWFYFPVNFLSKITNKCTTTRKYGVKIFRCGKIRLIHRISCVQFSARPNNSTGLSMELGFFQNPCQVFLRVCFNSVSKGQWSGVGYKPAIVLHYFSKKIKLNFKKTYISLLQLTHVAYIKYLKTFITITNNLYKTLYINIYMY